VAASADRGADGAAAGTGAVPTDASTARKGELAGILVVLVVQLVSFLAMAEWRLIDGDEGLYLAAARLMMEGRTPYTEFYWPQFPLVPLAYGVWSAVVGEGWFAGRALSAILASGTGTILFLLAGRRFGARRWGAVAVGIYLACGLTFAWQPLVKTYALTTFLLVAGFAVLSPLGLQRVSPRARALLAGGLVGAAVAARLLVAPCLVVFVVAAACQERTPRARLTAALAFALGAGLGLLPLLPHLLGHPDEFVYATLLSHADRNAAGVAIGDAGQKLAVATKIFGLAPFLYAHPRGFQVCESAQTATLALAVAGVVLGSLRRRRWPALAVWIVLALSGANLLPTPTFVQYFTTAVPFAALLAVEIVHAHWARRAVRFGALAFGLIFLTAAPFEIWRTCVSGHDVPVLSPDEPRGNWHLTTMREVARAVDALARPGEPVLAMWPGNLIGARAAIVPGFENQNTFAAALHQPFAQRRRFRLASFGDFLAEVASREHRLVIAGNYWDRPDARDFLAAQGYRRRQTFPGSDIELWLRDDTVTRLRPRSPRPRADRPRSRPADEPRRRGPSAARRWRRPAPPRRRGESPA
jgi:hypothetical protein